jgi:hypothetical protein
MVSIEANEVDGYKTSCNEEIDARQSCHIAFLESVKRLDHQENSFMCLAAM